MVKYILGIFKMVKLMGKELLLQKINNKFNKYGLTINYSDIW